MTHPPTPPPALLPTGTGQRDTTKTGGALPWASILSCRCPVNAAPIAPPAVHSGAAHWSLAPTQGVSETKTLLTLTHITQSVSRPSSSLFPYSLLQYFSLGLSRGFLKPGPQMVG